MNALNGLSDMCAESYVTHIYLQSIYMHFFVFQAVVHIPSIRDRFYAFVGLSGRNDRALDIGFGSPGYVLELARAFRSVSCIYTIICASYNSISVIPICTSSTNIKAMCFYSA